MLSYIFLNSHSQVSDPGPEGRLIDYKGHSQDFGSYHMGEQLRLRGGSHLLSVVTYSKTCVKQPLSKRPKVGFQSQLWLNAGQK